MCIRISNCEVSSNFCVDQHIVEGHVLPRSEGFQHHIDLFLVFLVGIWPWLFLHFMHCGAYLEKLDFVRPKHKIIALQFVITSTYMLCYLNVFADFAFTFMRNFLFPVRRFHKF